MALKPTVRSDHIIDAYSNPVSSIIRFEKDAIQYKIKSKNSRESFYCELRGYYLEINTPNDEIFSKKEIAKNDQATIISLYWDYIYSVLLEINILSRNGYPGRWNSMWKIERPFLIHSQTWVRKYAKGSYVPYDSFALYNKELLQQGLTHRIHFFRELLEREMKHE